MAHERYQRVNEITDNDYNTPITRSDETWLKPDKAPHIKKEEEKIKRRKAQGCKENVYDFPKPQTHFPFRGHFVWPITEFPISMYFSDNVLNSLSFETKCYIWYEPSPPNSGYYLTKISGNSRDSVEEATTRVRNLFIKVYQFKMIPNNGWIYHMIEQPHKPCKIKIVDPLPWIYLPYNYNDVKLIESVDISVVGKGDLGNFQKIRESNTQSFKVALVKAFEAIHLSDYEIKMRIRFGHVCLKQYPSPSKYADKLWSIEKFNEKVLKNTHLESEFSTCVGTEDQQLSRLLGLLSKSELKWDGSPFLEFKLCVINKIPEEEDIPYMLLVQFDKFINNNRCGGKIGPWKAIMNERNILGISMSHLDNDYSWKLNIQTAKHLPNNDKDDIQKKFVSKLQICPEGRLVYSNTNDIKVVSVCEKTRWKYWWKEEYVIEVTKYEFWNLSYNKSAPSYIEFQLNQESKPSVTYGVTLYKKSWDDDFATNSNLGIGGEPEWHPHEIMNEDLSGIDTLLSDIRAFLEVLQSNLPVKPIFIS